MLSKPMRFIISTNDAVLALIAEMKAKAADPMVDRLTAELCALTLENVLPMLRVDELRHGDDARE